MTVKDGDWVIDNTDLAFACWDENSVENMDNSSDMMQCFGISTHLRWGDVDLRPTEFRANSLEDLKGALKHVVFCAVCYGDI